jgi:uncharacterized protein Yka (UPF0111/DUF47 family)
MVAKQKIVGALGEAKLVLPRLVNEALAANDRIKYRFSLLQSARRHADRPGEAPHSLHAERLQAGLDDASLDRFVSDAEPAPDGCYRLPGARRLLADATRDLEAMFAPVRAAGALLPATDSAQLEARAHAVLKPLEGVADDRMAGTTIDAITHGSRDRGDSLHLVVMDLHRTLNQLQRGIAVESLDGASAYDLEEGDRPRVLAFMRGVNRNSPLRFEHPGLATTATRSGARLVIQNDLGTTDAHVLVVHVEGLRCTVTYTDIHLQRLLFFRSLFEGRGVAWEDTRSVQERAVEEGLYHLGLGRFDAGDESALLGFLEFLGSRLVFLIDWNKARKRLRSLVGKRDALALLRWAADHDIGHMGFLKAGGDRLIFDALEFAARGQVHLGQTLGDLLGPERAVAFLRFVMRRTVGALRSGASEAFIVDEVRAELMRQFRGSGQGLFDLVVEHASLVVELAGAVRGALAELSFADGAERARRHAERAKDWETDADRLLNQARAVGLVSEESAFLKELVQRADDVADDLEEAAFHATLLPAVAPEAELRTALAQLAELVVQGSQEFVKALECFRNLRPGVPREDVQDFLAAIHHIAVVEHETDAGRRRVASLLVASPADARRIMVASDCAASLELAADHLLHVALRLRDFALGRVAAA